MTYEEYTANYPGGEEALISKGRLYGMNDDVPKKTHITVIAWLYRGCGCSRCYRQRGTCLSDNFRRNYNYIRLHSQKSTV